MPCRSREHVAEDGGSSGAQIIPSAVSLFAFSKPRKNISERKCTQESTFSIRTIFAFTFDSNCSLEAFTSY